MTIETEHTHSTVVWQYRLKQSWHERWGKWDECSAEEAASFQLVPPYGLDCQVRKLFTSQENPHDQSELAMLIKCLVLMLRQVSPGNDLAAQAMDYLQSKGLNGSPLREQPE